MTNQVIDMWNVSINGTSYALIDNKDNKEGPESKGIYNTTSIFLIEKDVEDFNASKSIEEHTYLEICSKALPLELEIGDIVTKDLEESNISIESGGQRLQPIFTDSDSLYLVAV